MFLGLCAVLLLAAVPLTGGSLWRLSALPIRGVPVLVSALGVQVLVISVWPSMPHLLAVAGHLASYIALAWALWLNRGLPGMVLIGAGAGANGVTIAVNGGTLPASASALRAAGIHLRPGFDNSGIVTHPHLAWLGDVMVTPAWLPMRNMLSVGDLLLLTGSAVLVIVSTRRGRDASSQEPPPPVCDGARMPTLGPLGPKLVRVPRGKVGGGSRASAGPEPTVSAP